jgi:hypothetical protein
MIRHAVLAGMYLWMLALLTACGTLETGADRELPDTGIAILEGYKRFYVLYYEQGDISAVDGKRPDNLLGYVNSVRLLPGGHWIEIQLERYAFGGGGPFAICAFRFQFEAQRRYQIKAHSLTADVGLLAHPSHSPYKGSISLETSTPGGQEKTENVAAVCTTPHQNLCIKDSDCPSNYPCQTQPGFEFGACSPRDR